MVNDPVKRHKWDHDDVYPQECSIFARAGMKVSTSAWDFTDVVPLYNLITILR